MVVEEEIQVKPTQPEKLEIRVDTGLSHDAAERVLEEHAKNGDITTLLYLSVQGLEITEVHVSLLSRLVSQNKDLISIEIGNCILGDAKFALLVEPLEHCSNLEKVILYDDQLTNACIPDLCKLLNKGKVKNLIIGGNQIDAAGIKVLVIEALDMEPCRSSLDSLSLSGNPISDAGIELLAKWLNPKPPQIAPALCSLYLKQVKLGQAGIDFLTDVLNSNKQMKVLALENNCGNFNINGLIAVLKTKSLNQLSMDPEIFELDVMKALLVNPVVKSIAINKLKQAAKAYYIEKAEQALRGKNYKVAGDYYKCVLRLDPYNDQIAWKLDDIRVRLLQQQSEEILVEQKQGELEKLKNACQGIINQLHFESQALEKQWAKYIKEAPNKDDYGITDEGKHLRNMTASLQKLIQTHAGFQENPKLYPLFQAIRTKDRELIQNLIQQGHDPNLAGLDGKTAMHYAAMTHDRQLIDHLITLGARVDMKDKEEHFPWEYINEGNQNESLRAYLIKLQATHKTAYSLKVLRLLKKLIEPNRLTDQEKTVLKKKLTEIAESLKTLDNVYARVLNVYKEDAERLKDVKELYAKYRKVYDPILLGTEKPNCYGEPIEDLKRLEFGLVDLMKQLQEIQSNSAQQALGFYNEVGKCIADLVVLREFSPEVMRAATEYFNTTEIILPLSPAWPKQPCHYSLAQLSGRFEQSPNAPQLENNSEPVIAVQENPQEEPSEKSSLRVFNAKF
jgi:hypothetical protein